jgi:PE family
MSNVIAAPGMLAAAASDVAGIGSSIRAATVAAAGQTTSVAAAAADEVLAAIAALFSGHAQEFQALSAQASSFHSQFVQALNGAAGSYSATGAANAAPMQAVEQTVAAAVNALFAVNPTGSGSITATVNSAGILQGIAVSPTGTHAGDVYVSDVNLSALSTDVEVIDPSSNTVVNTINVPSGAGPVAVSPIGPEAGDVYVVAPGEDGNIVSIIS